MLIDHYLPRYHFREYHHIVASGTIGAAFHAVKNLDFSDSGVIRALFALRRLPISDLSLRGFVNNANFTWLEESHNEEVLIGFWMTRKVESIPAKDDFIQNRKNHKVRLVWNFSLREISEGRVNISTETRVHCQDLISRFNFTLYWLFIRPFSGWIRRIMLRKIKTTLEGPGEG